MLILGTEVDPTPSDLRELFRKLARAHEELWIERECYRHMLLTEAGLMPELLQERVAEACGRRRVQQADGLGTSLLWEALSDYEVGLLINLLLADCSNGNTLH